MVSKQMITLTQLAQRLGVSYSAVRRATMDGRLCASITRKSNGQYQVDAKLAIKEWQENTNVDACEPYNDDAGSELIPPYQISRREQK